MRYFRNLFVMLAAGALLAFCPSEAVADTVILHTAGSFQVLSVSPNGRWACGVFIDATGSTFPFRWNLESGSIEMLGADYGTAWDVANDGTVAGDFPDTEALANHASVHLPCYWRGMTRYGLEMPEGKITEGLGTGVSKDGHYMTGSVCKDGIYTSYIWKDGKIDRSLATDNHNVAFCLSPDGLSAAGYSTKYNRTACYWPAQGDIVFFEDSKTHSMGPWNYARNFSPDGTKLMYWGGWELAEDGTLYLYSVYDITTGERKKVKAPSIDTAMEFYDITNSEVLVGTADGRGYVDVAGEGMFVDDYLKRLGVDLRAIFDDMYDGGDYYVNQLPISNILSVSEDENIIAMQYYNKAGESCSMILKLNQDFTNVRPAEVKASQMDGLHTVALTWKRPVGANNIRGFNVYRDGKKLNTLPLNQLYYYDAKLANGSYNYEVAAVTTSGTETKAEALEVSVSDPTLPAPYSIFARQKGINAGFATWKAPLSNIVHKHYFDVETRDYSGFTVYEEIDMEVAIRYSKAEVSAYAGHKISEVTFIPMGEHKKWAVNLYTHAADNSLQLLYSQPVTQTLNYGTLNTVRLDTPQALPSGDLIVAIEISIDPETEQVVGAQHGPVTPGYSDLLRQKTEKDYTSAYESTLETGMTLTYLSWAIDLGLEPDGGAKATLTQYNVYVDGEMAGSTAETSFETKTLEEGKHTISVEAQYSDGQKSALGSSEVSIAANYPGVTETRVTVSESDPTEFTATWETPVNNDATSVSYTRAKTYSKGIKGNEQTNYSFMIASEYKQDILRGYGGYKVSSFRFYPLSDALFTFILYENGKRIHIQEVESDLTFKEWNTVKLDKEIVINENATYMLVIDCFDPMPNVDVFALDDDTPIDYVSDLVSTDNGETWNSMTIETGTKGSWMMGMVVESPQGEAMTVDGYDVAVDGKTISAERVSGNTFTGGLKVSGDHRLQVNTYYPGRAQAVEGEAVVFNLNLTAIKGVAADGNIGIVRGAGYLQVDGDGVESVSLYGASGALVANAKGNRIDIAGVASGVHVLQVRTAEGVVSRKITIEK